MESDKYVQYNQLVAEGIVKVKEGWFEGALGKFDAAQGVVSVGGGQRIEPLIYRAICFIEKVKAGRRGEKTVFFDLFRMIWRSCRRCSSR